MPRQRKHQADGIGVVVTARKTDDMRIFLAIGDGVGNVLRALDGVNHKHKIANALAAVGPQKTLPGF